MNPTLHRRSTFVAKVFPTCIEATALPSDDGPVDSYGSEHYTWNNYPLRGNTQKNSQSFMGDGSKLHSVKFYLKRGNPPIPAGNLVACLYAKETNASSNRPTGSPLAISNQIVAADVLPDAMAFYEFLFDDTFVLTADELHCITIEKADPNDIWDTTFGWIDVGADNVGSRKGMSYMQFYPPGTGSWISCLHDLIFEVWGV